jgi:flagellin
MALTVRTNVASLMAAGQLGRTQRDLTQSLIRIGSGFRVNRAADDAAGLGVATNLTTLARSTRMAMRNINEGISLIQVAESASVETTDLLQRIRELAVQSSSGTLQADQRSFVQDEFLQLRAEIGRIAASAEYSGRQLADGSVPTLDVQAGGGGDASNRIAITLGDLTTSALGIQAISLDSASGAQAALAFLDTALGSVNQTRARLGAVQGRLESALNNNQVYEAALTAGASRILDTDYATETARLTKLQIMQQAGVAGLIQAKGINQSVIALLS